MSAATDTQDTAAGPAPHQDDDYVEQSTLAFYLEEMRDLVALPKVERSTPRPMRTKKIGTRKR